MPDFQKGGTARTPFGGNEYLRSTKNVKKDSYTFNKAGIPAETIDDDATQKVLFPGVIVAKATSGAFSGEYGVFDSGATDGRQTAANIVGINDTFLPWQLKESSREIAVTYEATVVQAWCFEYVNGVRAALSNATRDAISALANNNLMFR